MSKGIHIAPLDAVFATDPGQLVGNIRYEDDKTYRFVQNAETNITFSAGDIVAHVLTNGTTSTRTIKQVVTANLGYLAGKVEAPSLKPSSYGWIQINGEGNCSVSGATTGGTNIAAGDYLKGVNAANYVVRDAATQGLYRRSIQVLTAVATTTTPAAALKACYISCLG